MKTIPLTRGFVAIIDDCDFERVAQHKWRVGALKNGYPVKALTGQHRNGTLISLASFILGCEMADHVDGDPLNNVRSNIRPTTYQQNAFNRKTPNNNTTGYKGVHRTTSGKFEARIKIAGVLYNLGSFETPEKAAVAYNEAAERSFGEFAKTNQVLTSTPLATGNNVNTERN
jgi:hypothetical protein